MKCSCGFAGCADLNEQSFIVEGQFVYLKYKKLDQEPVLLRMDLKDFLRKLNIAVKEYNDFLTEDNPIVERYVQIIEKYRTSFDYNLYVQYKELDKKAKKRS